MIRSHLSHSVWAGNVQVTSNMGLWIFFSFSQKVSHSMSNTKGWKKAPNAITSVWRCSFIFLHVNKPRNTGFQFRRAETAPWGPYSTLWKLTSMQPWSWNAHGHTHTHQCSVFKDYPLNCPQETENLLSFKHKLSFIQWGRGKKKPTEIVGSCLIMSLKMTTVIGEKTLTWGMEQKEEGESERLFWCYTERLSNKLALI